MTMLRDWQLNQFMSVRSGRVPAALACAACSKRWILLVCAIVSLCGARAVKADDKVTYDEHIAPLLKQRCGSCHNPTAKKGDFDVTTYLNLMKGGGSGESVSPGDADASYMFALVTHKSEPFMPQNADKLPDAELDLIKRWINGGALENAGSTAAKPKAKMVAAAAGASNVRPEHVAIPPRMVLEPALKLAKPPMARSLATHPWAPIVAVTSQRQVLLYDTKSLDMLGVLPFPEGQPNVVRFSRDGALLIAGGGRAGASGKVVVWDVATGERVTDIGNETDTVLAADISADHKRVALGTALRRVKVYSTETGALLYEIAKHTEWVTALEFSPDGVLLATADRNGGLCVWEAETGHEYLTLAGHTAAITAVAWRGDSNLLASASEDANVTLWEMENGNAVKKWNAKAALESIKFTRDGNLLTGGRDGVVRWWNQDGAQARETKPLGEIAVSVAFCDESQRAIAGSWSGGLQVFKGDDASPLGSVVTNPPSLDERLAAAKTTLEQKIAAIAPLADAKQKAEAEAKKAEGQLATAQQAFAAIQAKAEKLAAEKKPVDEARAVAEAERNKIAATITQNEAARPLVGEALRQVTEALGKVPTDAKLAEVQKQLTEQQKVMEAGAAAFQTKLSELTSAIANADAQLKSLNAQSEAIGKEAAAAGEQLKAVQAQHDQAAKALAGAQQAAAPLEAELAAAQQAAARWTDEIAFRDKIAALQKELEAARKVAADQQAAVDEAAKQLAAAQSSADAAKKQAEDAAKGVDAVAAKIREAQTRSTK